MLINYVILQALIPLPPPIIYNTIALTNRSQKIKFFFIYWPGKLHNPDISSVFSFFSRSATLFPRILLVFLWWERARFLSWTVSSRAPDNACRSANIWGVGVICVLDSNNCCTETQTYTHIINIIGIIIRDHFKRFNNSWKLIKLTVCLLS